MGGCPGSHCRVQEEQREVGAKAHQDQGLVGEAHRHRRPHRARLQGRGHLLENRKNKLNKAHASLNSEMSYSRILKNIINKAIKGFQEAVKANEAELKKCQCTAKFDAL